MGINIQNLPTILRNLANAIAVVIVVLAVALVLWTIGKHFLWRVRRGLARKQAHRSKHRPDGKPYPPTGMGICSMCEKADLKVFHLPSGRCLCEDCYARTEGLDARNIRRSRT